eukprot:3780074-Rhodomonas_salina.1
MQHPADIRQARGNIFALPPDQTLLDCMALLVSLQSLWVLALIMQDASYAREPRCDVDVLPPQKPLLDRKTLLVPLQRFCVHALIVESYAQIVQHLGHRAAVPRRMLANQSKQFLKHELRLSVVAHDFLQVLCRGLDQLHDTACKHLLVAVVDVRDEGLGVPRIPRPDDVG